MKGGCRYSSKGTYKVHCSTPNPWLSVTQQIIFRVQQQLLTKPHKSKVDGSPGRNKHKKERALNQQDSGFTYKIIFETKTVKKDCQ